METTHNVQLDSWVGQLTLGEAVSNFTQHAEQKAAERGIQLPSHISFGPGQIVEATVRTHKSGRKEIVKVVGRVPYQVNPEYDLVLVVSTVSEVVVTAYLNHRDDKHKTLDTSKLARISPQTFSRSKEKTKVG
jgi:hypothetical protein